MCVISPLAVILALGLRAAAVQLAPSNQSHESVLLVDIRGPTRLTGDGVRVMGMLMDLKACGHHVEVLSDATNYSDLKETWPADVAGRFFSGVHFWQAAQDSMPDDFRLSSFSRIVIGAKLDLLYTDGQEGVAVPYILSALRNRSGAPKGYRQKVEVFWDDVPFERCQLKPEGDEICPRVPAIVRDAAQLSHKFHVLSEDDKRRMSRDMWDYGIPSQNLEVDVWPLRIKNMQEVVPHFPFTLDAERHLVLMMGNLHEVNRFMVTTMFESGAVEDICSEIARRRSKVRIMFLGRIANVAEKLKKTYSQASGCVDVHTGFVDDEKLERFVFPYIRAVLNPFFEDVNSGISVKNFESIMSGVPFLTSEYGMHGLSDEMSACGDFPMPPMPEDPAVFARYFIDHVVDDAGYMEFARAFATQAPKCIEGQRIHHPVSNVC